jgi:hypothetical protein
MVIAVKMHISQWIDGRDVFHIDMRHVSHYTLP